MGERVVWGLCYWCLRPAWGIWPGMEWENICKRCMDEVIRSMHERSRERGRERKNEAVDRIKGGEGP